MHFSDHYASAYAVRDIVADFSLVFAERECDLRIQKFFRLFEVSFINGGIFFALVLTEFFTRRDSLDDADQSLGRAASYGILIALLAQFVVLYPRILDVGYGIDHIFGLAFGHGRTDASPGSRR